MTTAAPQVMYAHGPLTTPDGEPLWALAQADATPRPVTVRCIDETGRDLAAPVVLSGPIGLDALRQIVGDAAEGEAPADRFARRAFQALCDWQDASGRGAVLCRRLQRLDRLAMAAVKRDIPGIVTWGYGNETEGS